MRMPLALGILVACGGAFADVVQAAYVGPLGNPEEPALRPYKWALSGVGALFYQTGKHFRDGNMGTPVLGTTDAFRGAGIGVIELGESVYNGMVFAPITDYQEYKKLHKANQRIDNDLLLRNVRDGLSTVPVWAPLYPLLKFNDHYPAENEEKVQARIAAARAKREAQQAAQEAREAAREEKVVLTETERRQVGRNPERAARGAEKKKDLTGNLLKLGKK